jgi:replicative DNA helicase
MILCDTAAERAVLAGICRYGYDLYLDIADIIQDTSFTVDSNIILFKCLKNICEKESRQTIDIASIYSVSRDLSLDHILAKKEETQHLKAVLDFPVARENVSKFAAKIRKLEIARLLHNQLGHAQEKLLDVNGNENISNIIALAEDTILDFTSLLNDNDNAPANISENIDSYLQYLTENKVEQIGISTGFPVYDQSIGGGLRKSTVNVIAARPKTGKSLLVDNMGYNICKKYNIPVLNLDTEMTKEDHLHRLLALMTETEINSIETGKFTDSADKSAKITEAGAELKTLRMYYKSIAGRPFEEQIAIIRRWLVKEVGLNSDGTAKDCVIFYDYLKLMDSAGISQDMKEYQLLGFMMTGLHNFATRYKVPIVAFMQLNRDGITKETTDTASGSDRIIWLCSNFTIFKRKSDEEIAEDGPTYGNRKLVPVISRHGAGLDDNDYINCHMKGWCAKIVEGKTKLELANSNDGQNKFIISDDENKNESNESQKISFI